MKKIHNIEPYNELFFISCFYNCLFSIIKYHEKSNMSFLINNIPLYNYQSLKGNYLTINNLFAINTKELLEQIGIEELSKQNDMNVIADLISSIDENKPVLLNIDRYFMPGDEEFYLQRHKGQVILIYGYDEIQMTFNIIEQKHEDSLTYHKKTISYEDVNNLYKGYLQLLDINLSKNSFRQYYLKEDFQEEKIDYKNLYLQANKNYEQDIKMGLQSLESFIKDYELLFLVEQNIRKNGASLLDGLNKVINAKKTEIKILHDLFGGEHHLTSLKIEVETKWSIIRSKLARFIFSSIYQKEAFINLQTILNDIYQLESKFYNTIYEM